MLITLFFLIVVLLALVTYIVCYSWTAALIAVLACFITAGVCLSVVAIVRALKRKRG